MNKNKALVTMNGISAGLMGYITLELLLEDISTRSAIISTELAKAPILTDQVYQSAKAVADNTLGSGNFLVGLFCASMAGYFVAQAVYYTVHKEKE